MAFPPLGNSDHVVVSDSIDFPSNSRHDAPFHCIAYDYSRADWDGLCDHLRDIPWEDIFKLGAFAAASEFCEWVQVGIDVYIPHRKYQVKPHSSPWFSAACAAAIVHINHFFRLYQRQKSSDSNIKFRQASNRCKRVLDVPRCYKDVYVNNFFPCTARLWNSLPIECFSLTYDLSGFKSRINRYLLTVGSF